MNYNFSLNLNFDNEIDFVNYWEQKYQDTIENLYNDNIKEELTKDRLLNLFRWKNRTPLSEEKERSIINNYPLVFNGNLIDRYLTPSKQGGIIWNIFYLHIRDPELWPIFDQHVYRAMKYIQTKRIMEIPKNKTEIINSYLNEYIPFFNNFAEKSHRKKDKGLFTFGQFLKSIQRYL